MSMLSMLILLYRCSSDPCSRKASETTQGQLQNIFTNHVWVFSWPDMPATGSWSYRAAVVRTGWTSMYTNTMSPLGLMVTWWEREGARVFIWLTKSYLKCPGSTRRVFSLSHDGDITPLHCQPVGQAEDGDCGAVGPPGVQLERRRVSMVDVNSCKWTRKCFNNNCGTSLLQNLKPSRGSHLSLVCHHLFDWNKTSQFRQKMTTHSRSTC